MSEENKNLNNPEAVAEETLDETAGADGETSISQSISNFRRKLKFGGYSLVIIVVFLTAAVLVNVLFTMLINRFNLRFDLTERKLFSIEQSTTAYLSALDDTINFYFCSREENFTNPDTYFSQVYEIAQRFKEANRSFTITFVNRLTNPAFVAKYGGNLTDTDIVIESERTGRFKVVSQSDYFMEEFYFNGERISDEQAWEAAAYGFGHMIERDASAATEQAFLSAIMSVSDLTPVRVAFANGFGEIAYEAMMEILIANGYVTEEIDLLMTAEIDPGIDFLVICSPAFDYTVSARANVDTWLDNGGMYGKTLLYLPAREMPDTPVLDEFLEEWGMRAEHGFISQSNVNYALPNDEYGFMQFIRMVGGPFSEGIAEGSVLATTIRPITLLFEVSGSTSTSSLLVSYDGSFYVPLTEEEAEDWEFTLRLMNAVAMSRKTRFEGLDRFTSHVIAFGTPSIFDAWVIEGGQFSNARLLLNIFNDISGRSDIGALIMPKSFRPAHFEITVGQANGIAIAFVIIIPLIIITTGLVVFFKRRYR
ncbi:MAG: GldG family protein [Oscillospiraceae bacterium]|jgi:hypothetical protein|nr:GldG family protein [Oscillospiraceae bacterium]